MAYGLKYTLSFLSDRGNDYKIEILKKDYQGAPIAKKMGVAPVLNIAQGDGCIQGTSLTFAVQADVDGELQEFYTTDNKKFQVLLYRNGAIMWQGYLLPELYSETYVAPPYDVSLTATDQLATLKDIEYSREDEQVLLQSVLEYILSHTQLSLPLSYHMQLSMSLGRPMLENVYINQSAYNGSNCYDVLNAILLSMNCRIMQLSNQWLVSSATDSSENYYTERNLEVRPHKTLGQMYLADVYPNGTLGLVNAPALKGAALEYNHIFKKSILKNADCESRVGWEYMSHSSDDGRLPGEITSFGKIFKAYCWQLMPENIQKDASLHLWQDVEMPADDGVTWSLSFKHLFSTNAKLLLLAITHWDDKGVGRRLTGEGWVTEWDSSDVNSYIQVTGTPKSASLAEYSDIEQYEMSTVQFTLPPSNGTLRIGFINSTANYADPLAFAPIYVTQVYFTLGAVSGSAATTTIEPNATIGQEGVVLAMGDDVDSSNAVNVALNTLRRYDGGAIAGWMIGDRQFSSYFSMMLQEYSRYFGQKKRQLQGTIMGVDVLANIYKETYSNTVYRLVSADYNLLADEANVTLEEVLSNFVQFAEQVYATNNSNSFGSPTSGSGGSYSGGSTAVDISQLLRRDEAAETYTKIKDFNVSIGALIKRLDDVERYWYFDDNGNLHTSYNVITDNDVIAGGEYSGGTGGGGTSGFGSITIKTASGQEYKSDAKGVVLIPDYQPKGNYLTAVPNGYATENWVGANYQPKGNYLTAVPVGYATEAWVSNNYQPKGNYLTTIPAEYITESKLAAKNYITGISSGMVVGALGYTPFNSDNFTKSKIKSTLGIADWALAEAKPSYAWSEITGKPTFATVATSGKYSDLSGKPTIPTTLPASDVYDWAKAETKPTYTFGEIKEKPTTLSGYGITDAYTATVTDERIAAAAGAVAGNLTSHITAFNTYKTTTDKRLADLEGYWYIDDNGNLHTTYNIVSDKDVVAGGEYSGGGGSTGLGAVTIKTVSGQEYKTDSNGVVTIPDYQPKGNYLTAVPNGYATESWVGDNYQPKGNYLTGITSIMVTTALGYVPFNSTSFTTATIKSTLGIKDWALAASKPSYSWTEITGKPTFASIATSGKYSDLSGVPTSLPASDVYAWAKAATKPAYTFGEITSKPTTLAGYGITDALPSTTKYALANSVGGNAMGLHIADIRNTSPTPAQSARQTSITAWFTNSDVPGNHTWYSGVTIAGWTTNYQVWQLASGSSTSATEKNLYFRVGINDTWGAWQTILTTDNYTKVEPDARYLLTSGGSIKGSSSATLYVDTSNETQNNIFIQCKSAAKTYIGWSSSNGSYICNYASEGRLGIKDDGTPYYNTNTLVHSGNIGSYNAGSATKLQTARTIWGQSFDGMGNVSGDVILSEKTRINTTHLVFQEPDAGGWARGVRFTNTAGTVIGEIGGVGTVTDGLSYCYIAAGNYASNKALRVYSDGTIMSYTIQPLANLEYNLGSPTNSWGRVFTRYIDTLSGYDLRFCAGGTEYMKLTASNGDLHLSNGGLVVNSGFRIIASSLNIFEFTGAGFHIGYGLAGNYITQIYGGDGVYLRYGADRSYGLTIGSKGHTKVFNSFEVVGNAYLSADVTITGQVKASGDGVFGSDARYKSKLQDLAVDVETIANAPVFSYKWTDREDNKVHLGTTAQYWLETNFKDAVDTSNKDFYHLNYGGLGVAIGVTLAKEQIKVKSEVERLRDRVKELENQLKQLKQWHN